MVASKFTASPNPSAYRVDVVRGEQGNTYHVMRCELVARFDSEAHATFLVELLLKGQAGGARAES
jgi:hypothetical protein